MGYTFFDRLVAQCRFRAAFAHLQPGSRVCDVGCGLEADFLRFAGRRIGYGVGVDYQVSKRESAVPSIICADIKGGLPFRSGTFDHAVMLAVLEHLDAPGVVLNEAFRILVPGGSLIMTWPNAAVDSILAITRRVGLTSPEMESEGHVARMPRETLTDLLDHIGFTNYLHQTFECGLNNLLVAHKPMGVREIPVALPSSSE